MKTTLSISLIALFAALGSVPAYAHEVSQPVEGTEMHWIEHLNDPKPDQAGKPRGAEGPIREYAAPAAYCDQAFVPYYSTIGFEADAGSGGCNVNSWSRTIDSRSGK